MGHIVDIELGNGAKRLLSPADTKSLMELQGRFYESEANLVTTAKNLITSVMLRGIVPNELPMRLKGGRETVSSYLLTVNGEEVGWMRLYHWLAMFNSTVVQES